MDSTLIISTLLSFILSFIFAMGGIGSAIALVPALHSFVNLPLNMVKAIALLTNTLSMSGASISNLKSGRLHWRDGIVLIIFSSLFAPAGAYASHFLNQKVLVIIYIIFLLLSVYMMLFKRTNAANSQQTHVLPSLYLAAVGTFAGILAGLLGIGGGSIISPLLILKGYDPKKTVVLTASVIPFSAFTGFLAYAGMGHANTKYLIFCAGAGLLGGTLGTIVMHKWINSKNIKKLLSFILLLMAVKMIFQLVKYC
ncbi:MAG: sulfite exporter TauE/SafE family protein [Deltaproteobacteria bacterium]|nr:sulfite exporter TauE/SafE family protein [Deltaproteobacteria bacterium]